MREPDYDIVVIGGGINGAAVARDAAGRGLKVMLAERGDYAAATSSASSKLIHGGLRYLEHQEFALVRESLKEREIMLRIAPHLVHPLRFLLPLYKDASRPFWLVRAGLLLYDVLAGSRRLARSGMLDDAEVAAIPHLRQHGLTGVLHYADCQVDDARLVLATVLDARARGADVSNRRDVVRLAHEGGLFRVDLRDANGHRSVSARFVVNTAGPWVNKILSLCDPQLPMRPLRLIRGSHIVLAMPHPALHDAFTLQNYDTRAVFVIPWQQGRFVMIGTTDEPHDGDPGEVEATRAECVYLLDAYNRHFRTDDRPAAYEDIVWTWSGVRTLPDDGTAAPARITREVQIDKARLGDGGLVTVYGGKLTGNRRIAEKVLQALRTMGAGGGGSWSADAPLYGGALPFGELLARARHGPEVLAPETRLRWARTYGDVIDELFEAVLGDPACAREVAAGVPEIELRHVADKEDARSAEDFLKRRTKLFLTLSRAEQDRIRAWFGR